MKHTEIVRYDNDAAFVFLDCPCKGIDRTHVQMVSWLVCGGIAVDNMLGELGASGLTEKEDVWVFHCQLGKYHTV